MQCGLLGRKLGHSYSPQIHKMLGSYTYELLEKEPEELEQFLRSGTFSGLNVTMPYKKAVIPYLDELSPRADMLGSVNTIVRRGEKLIGHNTDYFGFEAMLKRSTLAVLGKKVLVLGSGGASNTAAAVLRSKGAHVVIISRTGKDNYSNLAQHADASVIVNTTPVGMYPNTDFSPINIDSFPVLEGVLDVIYNPAKTMLLRQAENRDLITSNGLYMLVAQAKESAEWFTDSKISDDVISVIHGNLRRQMENIVLVGMPGSGKTTVGKYLAHCTGGKFVDTDYEIEKRAGCTIPEYFAKNGESGFRDLETEVLSDFGKESGLIIATGGGCVTRQVNRGFLRQNGTLFCLNRDISKLPTSGRPLSQAGKLEEMFQIRKPMYDFFADHQIDNNKAIEDTANQILALL